MIDYWFFKEQLNEEEIKELNKFIIQNYDFIEKKESHARGNNNEKIKFAEVKCIYWHKLKDKLNYIYEKTTSVLREEFGYHIFDLYDHDTCNLNIYDSSIEGGYDWHIDGNSGRKMFDIKGTILINLSIKPYTGGEFQIFQRGGYTVEELSKPGNVIVFKSFLNHKVTKVLTGERRTLALFIKGPKFV
jgi:hypothetical protein